MSVKKFALLCMAILLFSCCYAQQKTDLIDFIIKSYDSDYTLDNSIITVPVLTGVKCPAIPDNFYDFFNTKFIDFASLREGVVKTFSFSDSLCSPLRKKLEVTSLYGMRKRKMHFGVDFKLTIGDTVCSVFCGKVRVIQRSDKGYGNVVVVRHYNMGETVYAHLSKILVDINQEVIAGEPIGLGGNTGRSTGPHLHFELRYKGFPINPIVDNKFLKHFPVY